MILEKEAVYSFSNVGDNVFNAGSDNSSFSVALGNSPIKIDPNSIDANVSVIHAQIWNTFFNVTSNNNGFIFKGITYNLYYPTQYNDTLFNQEVQYLNTSFGPPFDIVFSYDEIRQRTKVESATGGVLSFTNFNSIAELIGWTKTSVITLAAGVPQWAPNDSRYNTYQDVYIKSDICQNGIQENGEFDNVIGIVPNNVGTGFQINYDPNQMITSTCLYLKDSPKYNARFWLTDKDDNPLLLPNNFSFTITIKIKWKVLLFVKDDTGKLL